MRSRTIIGWTRIVAGGIAGTLIFDIVGFLLTRQWWDIPGLLSTKLGVPFAAGVLAHYGNGVILAAIYAGVATFLWGPAWMRALTYITAETVFGVWLFMLPLLDLGVAGVRLGALVPVITLLRHWGYGLVLAWLIPVVDTTYAEPVAGASHVARATHGYSRVD